MEPRVGRKPTGPGPATRTGRQASLVSVHCPQSRSLAFAFHQGQSPAGGDSDVASSCTQDTGEATEPARQASGIGAAASCPWRGLPGPGSYQQQPW